VCTKWIVGVIKCRFTLVSDFIRHYCVCSSVVVGLLSCGLVSVVIFKIKD